MPTIHYEKRDRTVLLTMQGDNDLNMSVTGEELNVKLREYLHDDEAWCCIITGAGTRSFSVGGNVGNFAKDGARVGPGIWSLEREHNLSNGMEFWKPLIAAVNGYCLGAGFMFALACDIRIASENATFSVPEIKYGFPAGLGVTQRLPNAIPFGPAMEILLTGDRFDARVAEKWGVVNHVVPQDQLLDKAFEVAGRITANPPLAVQTTKELAYRCRDLSFADGMRLQQWMSHATRQTEDAKEGATAFVEKRKGNFKGR
jgi:E-phenylitaconyl-CoA hydratase